MGWLWKHKLLLVLGILAVVYWFYNPAGRFGIVRNGFVVYNRIPILFFDCYIDPAGKLYLQGDLTQKENVNYWFQNYLVKKSPGRRSTVPLFFGTGMDDSSGISPDFTLLQKCRNHRFEPKVMSSRAAIQRFNALREQEQPCALLLKIR